MGEATFLAVKNDFPSLTKSSVKYLYYKYCMFLWGRFYCDKSLMHLIIEVNKFIHSIRVDSSCVLLVPVDLYPPSKDWIWSWLDLDMFLNPFFCNSFEHVCIFLFNYMSSPCCFCCFIWLPITIIRSITVTQVCRLFLTCVHINVCKSINGLVV